jgi:hypothetical protein
LDCITTIGCKRENRCKWPDNVLPAPAPSAGETVLDAIQPFLNVAEPIVHDDRVRWDPDEWMRRLNALTVGDFRKLHAAALAATPTTGEPT